MTTRQRLLMETLTGHFALLKERYPRKAGTAVARRAARVVRESLRGSTLRLRKAA